MNLKLGEVAALGTALCYSTSSIFFTQAGKKFGSMVSNRLRLVVAVLLLAAVHWVAFGQPLPIPELPSHNQRSRLAWIGSGWAAQGL